MSAAPHHDSTTAVLTATFPAPALAAVAAIAAAPVTVASFNVPATHPESPPSFILHEQFRI